MRKYIKLIVGLILILLFLQPLFTLFQMNVPNKIKEQLSQVDGEIEEESVDYLINLQKTDIQTSTDAYILEEMTKQLVHEAEIPLVEEHAVEIKDIIFYFESEVERSYNSLQSIDVYVQKNEGDPDEVHSIVDVEEVIIQREQAVKESEEDVDPIIETLEDVWEVHDKDVQVIWGEGPS